MTKADLDKYRSTRILVIGDVMLDHFIWGSVRRISPEAPVPIVEVTGETYYPGGAANVARNVSPFTSHVMLMGRVGRDIQADQLRQLLQEEGVNCEALLTHPTLPTISKARIVARQQQVVRVDREKIVRLSAEETVEVEHRLRAAAPLLDAIIIEDYGKGMVTDSMVEAVVRVAREFKILVTVDPSPRNPVRWEGVDLVKPNRTEAFAAAGIEDHTQHVPATENEELLRVGEILLGKWNVPRVLVTLGEQGMMLFQREGARHHIPTRAREVFDVSGAGDTAIALLTLALASGASAEQAADVANHASGIVVGKLGTARLTPDELLAAYAS